MSMFKNNISYLKVINKFSSNKRMIEEKCTTINVTDYMKSIKCDSEYFTNFVKSQGTDKYKKVSNIYNNFSKDLNTINKDFVVNEIIHNGYLIKLKKLIKENTGIDLSINEIAINVRKFDYNNDSGIRLYFLKEKNNTMTLVLVDLYHLVFPSSNRNFQLDYERKKDCRYDLKNICLNN